MARTITTIFNQIVANVQANPDLYDPTNPDPNKQGLTSNSQSAIWRLWAYIQAVAINVFEQILDIATVNFESIALASIVGNAEWWIAQIKAFQYSATNPQVITLDSNFIPRYATVDTSLQIITQVAIITGANRTVIIKTAKGLPGSLAILTSLELIALNSYIQTIQPTGVNVQGISLTSDKIAITGTVYYNGQYPIGTIQTTVIAAITAYLADLSGSNFNGNVVLSDINIQVRAVPGVEDFVISQAQGRDDATPYVVGAGIFTDLYNCDSGYAIPETTSSYTLIDTLTFTAR